MLGRIKRKVAALPQQPYGTGHFGTRTNGNPWHANRRLQGTPATAALAAAGVPFVAHPYSHDPAAASYGLEAAEVLGVDPARVFKTLMVDVDGRLAVGVVPVSGNLDLKAMAAALGGKKAAMADPAAAERRTGYVLGGISPLGQRQPSPTVLDDSALGLDTILVSGGRRGLDIELSPAELIRLTGAARHGSAPAGNSRAKKWKAGAAGRRPSVARQCVENTPCVRARRGPRAPREQAPRGSAGRDSARGASC